MKNKISLSALLLSFAFLIIVSFFFYPKWQHKATEATISWDVSGYYLYLPATFIYHDVKELKFFSAIREKYHPSAGFDQAFLNRNGAYVMKYSLGQSIMYSPFFFVAHAIALSSDYEADGFSLPYQFMISFGSLLVAFLGLFFFRKILLEYFSDGVSAVVIFILVFGTNYLDYTAINGALTHNYLFTIYCLLIWQTISFYKKATLQKALFIGFLVGLAALTRPVEVISGLIPVLWGIKNPLLASIKERFVFLKNNFSKLLAAGIICGLMGSLQLFYWKYSGGEWIIYSYQDQGFSWLDPHLMEGFFSYKSGWLVYTPIMAFALIGFIPLGFKKMPMFYASLIFSLLFIYITFAWDIWWYGGSLGQRAMVQAYAVLAFPLAAFISSLKNKKVLKYVIGFVAALFIYFNLWLTYQAHDSGMFRSEQMTKAYFWKIAGKWEMPEYAMKLLDTDEEFTGTRENVQLLFETNFEQDSIIGKCNIEPIEGNNSLCLNAEYQVSPIFWANKPAENAKWIRATADFRITKKEWSAWQMTQFTVRFYNDEKIVKERFIKIHRNMKDGQTMEQFIDVKIPEETYTRIGVQFLNAGSGREIVIDDLRVEAYD